MSAWKPIIYRRRPFQFPFFLRDEAGATVPLLSVAATLHDCPGEIEMAVTDFGGEDAGYKFLIRLEGAQGSGDEDKGTADISPDAVRLCVTVTYTDGDPETVIDIIVPVTEC